MVIDHSSHSARLMAWSRIWDMLQIRYRTSVAFPWNWNDVAYLLIDTVSFTRRYDLLGKAIDHLTAKESYLP